MIISLWNKLISMLLIKSVEPVKPLLLLPDERFFSYLFVQDANGKSVRLSGGLLEMAKTADMTRDIPDLETKLNNWRAEWP